MLHRSKPCPAEFALLMHSRRRRPRKLLGPRNFLLHRVVSHPILRARGKDGRIPITALVCWLKVQFLDAPVEKFRDKELVLAGAGDFVNPAKLAKRFAGLAQNAENFAVES